MQETSAPPHKEEKFKEWVRAYSDMLYHHAVLRGFEHDGAKDLVQETFYSAWKNVDGFEGKASVKNWLFVILKNKITDHHRRAFSRPETESLHADSFFNEAGHWIKPAYPQEVFIDTSDPSDTNEFFRIFEICSTRLNRLQKAVFFMKYVDELESDAICGQLAISSNNYWTMLHRAKVQLRSCLEKNWLSIK